MILLNEAWNRVSSSFDGVYDDIDKLILFEALQIPAIPTDKILSKFKPLCDPCSSPRALLFVSKRLLQFCKFIDRMQATNVDNELLRQLNVLLMYSESNEVVGRAIQSYNYLMRNNDLIDMILEQSKESEQIISVQYLDKMERDQKIFQYYIRDIEQSMNSKIHEGVDDIISRYYYCHSLHDSYHLIPRLIDYTKINNGYSSQTRYWTLKCIHKVSRVNNVDILNDLIHKNQLLLTLKIALKYYVQKDGQSEIEMICNTIRQCVSFDNYCLFSYDMLDTIIEPFVLESTRSDCREAVMSILNVIKDKIPTSKWKYLLMQYPVISGLCKYLKQWRWTESRIETTLSVIEYLLGVRKDDIGIFCIEQIKQFSEKIVFRELRASDDEIASTLTRIIHLYFTD